MAHEASTINAISQQPQEQMTRDEIIAFFDRRQAAYDRLDAAALAAQYAPECVVSSPAGGTHQGPAAVQRVLEGVFNAFLDMKVRTDILIIEGNQVAQVMTIHGTHVGEFMGIPGTNRLTLLAVRLAKEG